MNRIVEIGSKYRHFKGMIVEVIAIGKDSETLDDVVIYKHDNQVWVRNMTDFLSETDHDKYPEVKQKYRFEKMDIIKKEEK